MQFPVTTFPNEDSTFITPNWQQLHELAFRVSEKIIADNVEFDRIVTLAKGGWPMTRSLVDFLNVEEVASVGIKFYEGINRRMNRPEVYQDLPIGVKGEKVLLFDDVADTGESLEFTREFLMDEGVKAVTSATLFYKPHSSLKPDYYAQETNAWIIFPYEVFESMELFEKKWQQQGVGEKEIINRFKKLGINNGYIKHYRKLYSL